MGSTNVFNVLYNAMLKEARDALSSASVLTPDVEAVLVTLEKTVVVKKETVVVKKEKQPTKTPITGYQIFKREHGVNVRKAHPGMKPREVNQIIKQVWNETMNFKEREVYNHRALEEKAALKLEKEAANELNRDFEDICLVNLYDMGGTAFTQ